MRRASRNVSDESQYQSGEAERRKQPARMAIPRPGVTGRWMLTPGGIESTITLRLLRSALEVEIYGRTQARVRVSTSSGHSNAGGGKSGPDGDPRAAVSFASGVSAGPNGWLAAISASAHFADNGRENK